MNRSKQFVAAAAAIVTMATTITPVGASPTSGFRAVQGFATADFEWALGSGLRSYLNVDFNAGEVQNPTGSGAPTPFADVVVTLRVIDTQSGEVVSWAQGASFGLPATIVALEEATLDEVAVPLLDAGGNLVDTANLDLTWRGNDDASTRIDHQLAVGFFRQERFETATLSGSIELGGGVELGPDDAFGAVIGIARQISLP